MGVAMGCCGVANTYMSTKEEKETEYIKMTNSCEIACSFVMRVNTATGYDKHT